MHILYIYPEFTIKGGADKVIIEKANYLARHGYQVTLVTEAQLGRKLSFPLDEAVCHIDMGLDFNRQYRHGLLLRAFTYFVLIRQYKKRLRRVLQGRKPDIVASAIGRSIDLITEMKDGSVKIGEAHTVKANVRSFYLMEQKGGFYWLGAKFMKKKTYGHVARLDALVLLTPEDARSWSEVGHTFVIPNAVPFNTSRCSSLDRKQAIMVARYNDAKGFDYMIAAWQLVHRRHPDWVLNVFGSGEMHDQVAQWIQEKGLEGTILMHDPVENIVDEYLQSSLCVMSSRYEGFPMVLLEAMACGVPCVAFDCPHGPRNIIRHEEDGLLVDYLNVEALADSICRLIENDDLRRQMGAKAKTNIRRFSQEAVMKQWEDLFEHLLKSRRA
jgi:glycosyltransferase involved in cell wall biosynthesis